MVVFPSSPQAALCFPIFPTIKGGCSHVLGHQTKKRSLTFLLIRDFSLIAAKGSGWGASVQSWGGGVQFSIAVERHVYTREKNGAAPIKSETAPIDIYV